MKFKVGNKVRVIKNKDRYYSTKMQSFIGKVCTIAYVNDGYCKLVEDYKEWLWDNDMLEPIEEKQPEQVLKEQVQQIAKENEKSKMKIILLSGKARHGKDSAAKMMFEKLTSQGKKVLIAHYGDLVKYTCKTFFNWNGEKDEKGRTLLQRVGTDDIRAKYPDFWVDYVKSILDVFHGEWDYVLIPDTRFPNEVDLMKNSFDDVTSVCVVRTNFVSPLTDEQRNHKSEIALDEHIFDYYLIADDLEKLEKKVDVFLKEMEVDKCK